MYDEDFTLGILSTIIFTLLIESAPFKFYSTIKKKF